MWALLSLALLFSISAAAEISLVGSARIMGRVLRLTPAQRQHAGAAWFPDKRQVASGFRVAFDFQITERGGLDNGADGLALVLQNQGPDALAGRGGAGGFAVGDGFGTPESPGIARSIAVFFDMHRNAGEPSNNYVAICTNGPVGKMRWPPTRLGVSRGLPVLLKDGRVHRVVVEYDPPMISVRLNGTQVVRAPVDLRTILDSEGDAWIGFTASTGNGYQNHDILNWSFDVTSTLTTTDSDITYGLTDCLEGKNLCTPREAVVEEVAPRRYRIVLPANSQWGAAVPNPSGRTARIENGKGVVCLGAEHCGGPQGIPATGLTLLQADRPAGSVIARQDGGRTWFSVNGDSRHFGEHQGFVEFDVFVE